MPMTRNLKTCTLKTSLAAALLAGSALAAPSAFAQDDSGFSLSANTAIVSDYRFRGISLSDRDFALQGGMDVEHDSGFYVGAWGSSIDTFGGSEFELDIYAGYATKFGDLDADFGLLAYTYPGSDDTTYIEFYSSLGGTAGTVDWTVGGAYVWDQENVGSTDNIYLYLDAGMPLGDTPFSLAGHIAYEDGAFGDDKWDWNVGVAYAFEQFELSVAYVDTANVGGRLAKGSVVAMLSASF